ncbi:MAG: plasmid pRiA4b ORF-3 family protein [Ruminococcus flavefaciens]|nr:plasmid pRiA4b ORF-3 family protein [Ruminococcus flavefaciens]MCM1061339.1 plasmid pRiA4b ORF-3 family protein [Eubacterium sp.]
MIRIRSEYKDGEFGDIPTKNDTGCSVYEMLCKYADIWYIYDMGDYWQYKMELPEVTKEHENIMPTCLKVTGKTPLEDCGSVGGYQELLQQIADGNEEMIKWEEHSAEKIKI